ncbi:MAG TPA: hypothetical protein VE398_00545 [Acidobacteriota bacterium]|nr:hypothetical protein [Acidobacteriota bacterium]
MMHTYVRSCALAALATVLIIGIPPCVRAQAPSSGESAPDTSRRIQAGERGASKNVPPEKGVRDDRSAADQESQLNQSMDRELLQVRRQLEAEALNRMRFGRTGVFDRVMADLVPFSVFLVITFVLLWIFRIVLDNRRWYRMVKVQTDIHTKLLDRFASSQDMIVYMESDAGKRFLESPRFDIQPRQSAAFPYGRILWSAQVGLIAATLGGGLLFLRGRVPPEGDTPLLVFGTLALMLGFGFLLSAAASYILSKHFGLLEHSQPDLGRLATEPDIKHS